MSAKINKHTHSLSLSLSLSLYAGCDGGMGAVSEVLALFRAHLLLGGHYAATASGGEEIPDNGPYLEEDHGQRPPGPQGQLLVYTTSSGNDTSHTHKCTHSLRTIICFYAENNTNTKLHICMKQG